MSTKTYMRMWQFQVARDKKEEFEKVYGPNGNWAQLFRKNPGFLKIELLRDLGNEERYITVDSFQTKAIFEVFLHEFKSEYDNLDRHCEGLTLSENKIGEFENLTV